MSEVDSTDPEFERRVLARCDAPRVGLTDRDLYGESWRSRLWGVHSTTASPEGDVWLRTAEVAETLPIGAHIIGWPVLHALGVDWLDGLGWSGKSKLPVPVCVPPELHVRGRKGVLLLRSEVPPEERTFVHGIPMTVPIRACFDEVRLPVLRDRSLMVQESVVALDAALAFGVISESEFAAYLRTRSRWNGVPRARLALKLCDERVRSPWESRFRVLWCRDAGLPVPEVNLPVFDATTGELLGYPDLLDPASGLVGEYDGNQHRDVDQHCEDNVREEKFESRGLTVVRAGGPDLTRHRDRTVERLQDGYRRARTVPARWSLAP